MIAITAVTLFYLIIGTMCVALGIIMIKCDIDMVLNFLGWILIAIGVITILCGIGFLNVVV